MVVNMPRTKGTQNYSKQEKKLIFNNWESMTDNELKDLLRTQRYPTYRTVSSIRSFRYTHDLIRYKSHGPNVLQRIITRQMDLKNGG